MPPPRTLLLFDPQAQPSSWNERMSPGEYAVHYSHFDGSPTCTVLDSLPAAEDYAREQVALQPTLRCRIYDHQGFIGAPIAEIRGDKYIAEPDFTPRFRRWGGSILLFGGLILVLVDWRVDFKLGWPAMIGSRMLIPGFILLFIEAMIVLTARRSAGGRRPA